MIKPFLVNEIFSSIQGEGPNTGKLSLFIRLAGCNLTCKECDSKHSWITNINHQEVMEITSSELMSAIESAYQTSKFNNIVFTGGEPMMQMVQLENFIESWFMSLYRFSIEIETNGSIDISRFNVQREICYNISPKLKSFEQLDNTLTYSPSSIRSYTQQHYATSCLKFVISPEHMEKDIDEIVKLQTALNMPAKYIYLMPIGTTKGSQISNIENLVNTCKLFGFNISLRTHIIMFGNKRKK